MFDWLFLGYSSGIPIVVYCWRVFSADWRRNKDWRWRLEEKHQGTETYLECRQVPLKFYDFYIHHFHIVYNAPCLTIVLDFSWDDCSTVKSKRREERKEKKRKWKQWLCKILGGKQGALWSMWKWWIDVDLSNRPHFLWVYRRDNPLGMLGEHEKRL